MYAALNTKYIFSNRKLFSCVGVCLMGVSSQAVSAGTLSLGVSVSVPHSRRAITHPEYSLSAAFNATSVTVICREK